MKRFWLMFILTGLGSTFAETGEIILTDGTVLKEARVMSYSPQRGRVMIAEGYSLRSVELQQLPVDVRERVLSDYRAGRVRVVPEGGVVTTNRASEAVPQKEPVPSPAISGAVAAPVAQTLKERAAAVAADEVRFQLLESYQRLSALDCKVRSVEEVAGWSQIRVTGVAAFSMWEPFREDYVWRSGKFEVVFDVVNGDTLEADTVTFDGISHRVE